MLLPPVLVTLARLRFDTPSLRHDSARYGPRGMNDIYSPNKRSEIMSRVRATGTKPEQIVRRLTHALGYRFRLHYRHLPGTPDLVFPRHRRVIFVHGCFWHSHANCYKAKVPVTNSAFWTRKLARNRARDRENIEALTQLGWRTLVIWECETKHPHTIVSILHTFFGTYPTNDAQDTCSSV